MCGHTLCATVWSSLDREVDAGLVRLLQVPLLALAALFGLYGALAVDMVFGWLSLVVNTTWLCTPGYCGTVFVTRLFYGFVCTLLLFALLSFLYAHTRPEHGGATAHHNELEYGMWRAKLLATGVFFVLQCVSPPFYTLASAGVGWLACLFPVLYAWRLVLWPLCVRVHVIRDAHVTPAAAAGVDTAETRLALQRDLAESRYYNIALLVAGVVIYLCVANTLGLLSGDTRHSACTTSLYTVLLVFCFCVACGVLMSSARLRERSANRHGLWGCGGALIVTGVLLWMVFVAYDYADCPPNTFGVYGLVHSATLAFSVVLAMLVELFPIGKSNHNETPELRKASWQRVLRWAGGLAYVFMVSTNWLHVGADGELVEDGAWANLVHQVALIQYMLLLAFVLYMPERYDCSSYHAVASMVTAAGGRAKAVSEV